jgi:two-component system sensor histidine kinase EvgS
MRTVLAVCMAVFAAAASAQALDAPIRPEPLVLNAVERGWLADHPHPRVFTKTEWAPIDLYTYEGQFRGLSGDYLALIAQRLGIRFEFKPMPTLAASLEALKKGEAEILPSVSRTPQREVYMDFSQPYLDVPNVYVTRRDVVGVGPDEPMSGLRVAVEQGYAVASLIHDRHPATHIVEFADSAAALRGVSEGHADVYLGALPTTSFLVEKLLLSNLEVRGAWHSKLSALHLGVRKGDTVLLSILDKALANLTLAERQDIHRRWAPLHSLLSEPSPPLKLTPDEQRLVATLPALRVGYETDYRPYSLRTDDGQFTGMASDYLHLVADKIGLRAPAPQGGTWSDVFRRARHGELDLLVAVSKNEEREREFIFVGPWISTPNVLVTPRGAPPVLNLAQYTGRRVAVLRDGQTAYLMRRLHPHVRLVDVAARADLLAVVANGHADAALVNATFAAPMLAQGLGSVLRMAAFFPELNSDLYFAVRRDQSELAAVLGRALASINDSERAAIAARWAVLPKAGDAGLEARAALRRLLPLFAAMLVALLVSVLWGVWLKREVRRRRHAESALAQARDGAEALARMRHDFLTEASHEIRTPVNAVVGALDRLSQRTLPSQERELASLARRAAQTLSEYVNNLLDLSKSDAGELHLVLQPDSLPAALQAAAQAVEPVAHSRGIEVLTSLDDRLAPHHLFDAFRLRQVVLNLLSNAVKFGGTLPVRLHAEVIEDDAVSQRVRIRVVDQGQGIDPQRLPRLFEPYAQAGDSIAHRSGGTGLGLALCKRLLDAMGGRITIDSEPGRGTRITVELTLPVADAVAPAAPQHAHGDALRVLLVDDDRVQQILLEALLMQAGCVVDVAGGARAAQALWLQHHHGLVITDLQMPGMGGLELAAWLRSQPDGSAVHLVGTSADLGAGETARAAGIQRLLSKPVPQALIDELVQQTRAASGGVGVASAA